MMLCLPFLLVDNSIVRLGPQPAFFQKSMWKAGWNHAFCYVL